VTSCGLISVDLSIGGKGSFSFFDIVEVSEVVADEEQDALVDDTVLIISEEPVPLVEPGLRSIEPGDRCESKSGHIFRTGIGDPIDGIGDLIDGIGDPIDGIGKACGMTEKSLVT